MRARLVLAVTVAALITAACASTGGESASTGTRADATEADARAGASGDGDALDTSRLPVGDGRYGSSPEVGAVYTCQQTFAGPAASATGDWFHDDGTFDLDTKPTVDGEVTWPGAVTVTRQGSERVITSNGVPDGHTAGEFPVATTDDAYAYDRNPNRITTQSISLTLPAQPEVAAEPSCLGMGAIGVMTTGVVVFNALDAAGQDAVAHEIQDHCAGHPQQQGVYHYHWGGDCLDDPGTGHSALLGYALDGFGIFGVRGEDGSDVTNADLDACHGHTHVIEWDGEDVEMYHYHLSVEYPYTLGCYRGTPSRVEGVR